MKKIIIGEMIRNLRERFKLNQDELGKKINVSGKTISSWEIGRTEPNMGYVQALADIFGVTTDQLIYGSTDGNDSLLSSFKQIPLYSLISCGTGLFVDDNIEDYIAIPDKYLRPNKEYFANTARGDSMIGKGIKDNDVLVFEKTTAIENGEIGAFCIDNSEAVCKTFRKLPSGLILLESANPNYEPIEVDVNDECFRVVGKYKFKFSVEQE